MSHNNWGKYSFLIKHFCRNCTVYQKMLKIVQKGKYLRTGKRKGNHQNWSCEKKKYDLDQFLMKKETEELFGMNNNYFPSNIKSLTILILVKFIITIYFLYRFSSLNFHIILDIWTVLWNSDSKFLFVVIKKEFDSSV